MHLGLQESYCLPVSLYVARACSFQKRQLVELVACWNAMYRKYFKFNQWECVKCFINGLGRLDFHHIFWLQL